LNRDNLLFATIGLLFGFIGGYLLHEVMVARQPPRRSAGETVSGPVAAPSGGEGGDPGVGQASDSPAAAGAAPESAAGTGGAAPGGGPAMQEVQQLRDYVASHPQDAEAVIKLAGLNVEIRNWDRARDLYRQYLALRPRDADVTSDLGIAYRELRDYEHALDQFRRAQKLAAGNWKALFNEVVVLAIDLKRYDDAAAALDRLKKIQPANPDVAQLAAEVARRKAAAGQLPGKDSAPPARTPGADPARPSPVN
jgi:Flp pilus assembly protein TadD